ncbi:hypothetical protein J2R98_001527 [Alkalibacillus filiformis]|uniref:Uncharacterized protein n=1 Tax=Alkalibacillus filiformis TaxID=200990 RepID=A0ABU0DTM0_9BACI|nr:hypothetical protein [Alkalibacillus filiformis]MDQ0351710.1 hypothetical protein [Alkalibacillus filiformis]
MKSEKVSVTITNNMIHDFEQIFGKQDTLSPVFPMIFYRYIEVPWETPSPPVLRKQHGTCTKELTVGKTYHCQVVLEAEKQRRNNVFYTQCLYVYDEHGEECVRCVSELVTSSPLQKKK